MHVTASGEQHTRAIKTTLDFIGDQITWTAGSVSITLQYVRAHAYSVTTSQGPTRIDERCAAYLTERDARNAARVHAEYYRAQLDGEATPVPSISTPAETTVDVPGDVLVGLVTLAKGGRYHLALTNDAPCNSGRGAIIKSTRRLVAADLKPKLCKHCRARIDAALDDALEVLSGKRRNAAMLAAVALGTPSVVAAEQEFLADMAGSLVNPVCNEPIRPKSLADLRALHLAAIERAEAERTGQLPLGQVA